jgi:acyl-coenzyme A synthetase/AMP-(fatty) acid ligase
MSRSITSDSSLDTVAEAAVVGVHDELTGQAVNAFVALKDGHETNDQVKKDLVAQVRKSIGPFAAPKAIFIVPDLPKTRSGKIMRRILRKILSGEEDSLGDTSTVSFAAYELEIVRDFLLTYDLRSCRIHQSST